jgi:hypothetical protein
MDHPQILKYIIFVSSSSVNVDYALIPESLPPNCKDFKMNCLAKPKHDMSRSFSLIDVGRGFRGKSPPKK